MVPKPGVVLLRCRTVRSFLMIHKTALLIFQQGRPARIFYPSELTPVVVHFHEEPSRPCRTTTPASNTLPVEMDLIV